MTIIPMKNAGISYYSDATITTINLPKEQIMYTHMTQASCQHSKAGDILNSIISQPTWVAIIHFHLNKNLAYDLS